MLMRVGLAVTCSLAVLRFRWLSHKRLTSEDDRGGSAEEKVQHEESTFDPLHTQQKAPPEEVKRVNAVSPERSLQGSDYGDKDLLLPEFDDLLHTTQISSLAGKTPGKTPGKDSQNPDVLLDAQTNRTVPGEEVEDDVILLDTQNAKRRAGGKFGSRRSPSPAPRNRFVEVDVEDQSMSCATSETSDWFPDLPDELLGEYVDGLANDAAELQSLRDSFKVREIDSVELKKELQEKTTQILKLEKDLMKVGKDFEEKSNQAAKFQSDSDSLVKELNFQNSRMKARIAALEVRTTNLSEEAANVTNVMKDLEEARARCRELQKQMKSETGNDKMELLMLKQKIVTLEEEKENGNKRDLDTEEKLQLMRELEVEVVELRRAIKELQHQKRELAVRLTAAETENEDMQNRLEDDLLAEADAQMAAIRHANEDLSRQVEGLQNERFTEVEELVYLRWVNACLRYELRNFQAQEGKSSALDLKSSLSPKSQEKAKQLMLQYASPDQLALRPTDQIEGGYESASSETSTQCESVAESSEVSYDLGSVSERFKKSGLVRRLKVWTGKKEDGSEVSSASSSMDRDRSPRTSSDSLQRRRSLTSKGPLEALLLRNASDTVEILTYGTNTDSELGTPPPRRSLSNVSSPGARSIRSNASSPSSLTPVRTRNPDRDAFNGIAASFQIMSKSVPPEFSMKYPNFKDRHKAAMEREQAIKEKAQAEREKVLKVKLSQKFQEVGQEKLVVEPAPAVERAQVIPRPFTAAEVEKRALRKPTPSPQPSSTEPNPAPSPQLHGSSGSAPPPPPPPPPFKNLTRVQGKHFENMHRAPEVVEFYQSLMKRDGSNSAPDAAAGANTRDARNNMIGEIENRSAHLLAIKADVETQGDFVMALATEVRAAVYNNIEDLVAFVNWLDEELSFLVDERAVLKHFDWPEGKADAMREAAFEYQDLMKLLADVSLHEDKPEVPREKALKKMLTILEKVEESVYGVLRTRDMAIARYKEFSIPTQWMLDSGVVGKIKAASVKLAQVYMKRVALELDKMGSVNEPVREFLLLQGVRFAFRVHQFAGGFDPESMKAFEALRACVSVPSKNPPAREDIEEEED